MFRAKQYVIELSGSFLVYALLLFAANAIERATRPAGTAKLLINLMPMLGAIAVAGVIMRALGRMDEMQRRIQFDAIALSFVGTALITFAWGFGEGAGLPHLRAFAVWPIMASLWILGTLVAVRRYR